MSLNEQQRKREGKRAARSRRDRKPLYVTGMGEVVKRAQVNAHTARDMREVYWPSLVGSLLGGGERVE